MGESFHYTLTKQEKETKCGVKLFRIRATRDIPEQGVLKGQEGGWVSSTHVGGKPRIGKAAWVADDAEVFGKARVTGRALVRDSARIFGHARVKSHAVVAGDAQIYGHAKIGGTSTVYDSFVCGHARIAGACIISVRSNIYQHAHLVDSRVECALVSGHAFVRDSFCAPQSNVSGRAKVMGTKIAWVKLDKDAVVESPHDYVVIEPIGNVLSSVTVFRSATGVQVGGDVTKKELKKLMKDPYNRDLIEAAKQMVASKS